MHILVVGSSVIDLFMTVDKNHIETRDRKVILNLGDKIPSEIKKLAVGGNGANVSVGLCRLEIPASFYTYLGSDVLSRKIEEDLSREGVALASKRGAIQNAPLHIILDFTEDRVILSHYEHVDHDFSYDGQEKFDFIFLNSLADTWEGAYQKVYDYAKKNNIPFAFSPGSRQLDRLDDLIYQIIGHTKIFFSNKEEAVRIIKKEETDIKVILKELKKLGPSIISVTDGPNGAYAIDENNNCYFIKPAPTDSTEKTGAGDAYATGFFASILHGNNTSTAMTWGTLNAGGVMQDVGAESGLLSKEELDRQLKEHNNLKAELI